MIHSHAAGRTAPHGSSFFAICAEKFTTRQFPNDTISILRYKHNHVKTMAANNHVKRMRGVAQQK